MAIITISRGTFSGGSRLASCLATNLEYRLISREVLAEAAQQYGVLEESLAKGLQQAPGFWDRFRIDRESYLAALTATACKMVRDDNVVYHGHAGHFLLPSVSHVFRVRVIAPLGVRVAEAMASHGFDHRQAEEYIGGLDEERASWTRFLYGVDWQEPTLYDLVLNLDKVSVEVACEVIATIVRRKEFRMTDDAVRKLDDLYLASHVKAKLFLNPKIAAAATKIQVAASDGVVSLSGVLPGGGFRDEVLATIENLDEAKEVRSEWLGSHVEPV